MPPVAAFFASLLLISATFGLDSTSTTDSKLCHRFKTCSNSTLKRPLVAHHIRQRPSIKLESSSVVVIISGNATIQSENRTFELGFFNTNDESRWYLGIWYASIPTPTYVWVANRETPAKNLASAKLEITADGLLTVKDSGDENIWRTENTEKAAQAKLLEEGNLVLLADDGTVVWQSFDHPTDTWLPGMNLTTRQRLTSWKSSNDPSPGRYSLRLRPPEYGEIELVFSGVDSYWSTGNWTGNAFTGVPQMTIPYIYRFQFVDPFTPAASFGYTETSLESGTRPPLTRFQVESSGQLRQYTWSPQAESWSMFWSQPENLCRVYGLCGNLGFCNTRTCKCLAGFYPVDEVRWYAGDFSGGCRRESDDLCGSNDAFEDLGAVSFDGALTESFSGSRSMCERACLSNCSCIGLYHNTRTNLCKNLFGSLLNLRNLTSDSTIEDILYVRVQRGGESETKKSKNKTLVLIISTIVAFMVISTLVVIALLFVRKGRIERRKKEEEAVFPVTNLKVFSYKELHAATRGFSEKLGHGGFGAVFRGQLPDSSLVAVKRLERPGGGEREFRAEVCTIGNIQHVNLVRLRGFCSENSHRLLVYDYMPNGPLSAYLHRDGQSLSWEVRFGVATGMARGIAYLHEECRDCIIHCDIKPENILLDKDFSAKVSDFGLAKLLGRDFSRVVATMRGTWGYVAPEWISGVAITAKADVYSYGMTLLELLGGRRNVEGPPSAGEGGTGEKWFFPPWAACQIIEGNAAAVVDVRLGGMYNVVEAERAGLVAVWCIQDDETMRPTMGTVVKMLEGVMEVSVPPPPKLLQALVSGDSFQGVGADSSNRVSSSGRGGGCFDDDVQLSVDSKDSQSCL
uniref:Receptor-like serine/threonine-protein kinase n=1 Tax=Davidia involucrata TaxID=16924 RepID=A0A5B6ZFU0_DAVIN